MKICIAVFILLLLPNLAHAQPAEVEDVESAEVADVIAAVRELWEAMRAGDSTRARTVVHEDAIGYSIDLRAEETVLRHATPDAFIAAIGSPRDDVWDERVFNERVEIDGALATYFADYEFWLGSRQLHCGVDAFQLWKSVDGWKIFVLTDTRRACGE